MRGETERNEQSLAGREVGNKHVGKTIIPVAGNGFLREGKIDLKGKKTTIQTFLQVPATNQPKNNIDNAFSFESRMRIFTHLNID